MPSGAEETEGMRRILKVLESIQGVVEVTEDVRHVLEMPVVMRHVLEVLDVIQHVPMVVEGLRHVCRRLGGPFARWLSVAEGLCWSLVVVELVNQW